MQVRFISVNDNYDSDNNKNGVSSLEIPFKNLIYDYYSKDISQKICSSVKVRQDKGYYFGSKVPYGYKKDKNDHHHLIVDEEVSPLIKEIFDRYLGGESMFTISKSLNERNILTPARYIGIKRGCGFWLNSTVRHILTQRIYIGTITSGKSKAIEVGSTKKKATNRDSWIVRENMYEAIISRECFDKVQDKLSGNESYVTRHRKHFHILQDKVYCGKCNHKMSYTIHHGKSSGYYCPYRYKLNHFDCIRGKITSKTLEYIISKEIKLYTIGFLEKEETRKIQKKIQDSICKKLLDIKKKLELERQKLQAAKMSCYDNYKQCIIDKQGYLDKKESLHNRLKNIEKEFTELEHKIKENIVSENKLNINVIKEVISKGIIVKEWLDELVDKILVYDKDKVEIVWKFEKEKEI